MMHRNVLAGMIVMLAVLAGPVLAEAPMADRLPSRTMVYFGWAGATPAGRASQAGQFAASPQFQRTIELAKQAFLSTVPPSADSARDVSKAFTDMVHVGAGAKVCFALVDLPKEDEPMPGIVIIVELGDHAKQFQASWKIIEAQIPKDRIKKRNFGQVSLYDSGVMGPLGRRFVLGLDNNTFYLVFGKKLPEEILGGPGADSLAKSAEFKRQFGQVDGKNVQLAAYVQTKRLLEASLVANAQMPSYIGRRGGEDAEQEIQRYKQRKIRENQMVRQVLAGLGLDKAEAFAGAVRVTQDGLMQSKYKLFTPAPHNGLLMVASGKPLTQKQLSVLTGDTIYGSVVNVPSRRILLEASRIFGAMPIEGVSLDKIVMQIQKETDINLLTDVYDNLGDVSTITMTRSGGGLASLVVSFDLKDTQKFDTNVLAKIRKMMADIPQPQGDHWRSPDPIPSIQKMTIKGQRIEYLSMPIGDPFPVSPAWMLRDGKLYLAAWPQALQHIVDPVNQPGKLIDNADFAKKLTRLGKEPVGVFYIDTPELMRQLYPFALAGWTTLANVAHNEIHMSLTSTMLPTLGSLAQSFGPGVTTLSAQADGVVIEQIGTVPTLGVTALPAFVPLGTGASLPALQLAQIKAKQALAMVNVKAITMACIAQGMMGETLLATKVEELVASKRIEAKMLRSPFNPADPPVWKDDKLVGKSDYRMLLKKEGLRIWNIPDQRQVPLVVDISRPYDPKVGTPVGYADGHVEWYQGDMKTLEKRAAKVGEDQ